VWKALEEEGIPGMISSLRSRFSTDQAKVDVKESEDSQSKPSEEAMSEAEKYENEENRPPKSTLLAAEDKVKQDAKRAAEYSGKDFQESLAELMKRTKSKRYKVFYESLPGAPFYRCEYYGSQLRLFINMSHRFYRDLYNHPDVKSPTKNALDLLLFALGYCEN